MNRKHPGVHCVKSIVQFACAYIVTEDVDLDAALFREPQVVRNFHATRGVSLYLN